MILPADMPLYRGSRHSTLRVSPHGESGPGIYMTTDQAVAQRYASAKLEFAPGAEVTGYNTTRPLRLLDRSTREGEERFRSFQRDPTTGKSLSPDEFMARMKTEGYDGVSFPGVIGENETVLYDAGLLRRGVAPTSPLPPPGPPPLPSAMMEVAPARHGNDLSGVIEGSRARAAIAREDPTWMAGSPKQPAHYQTYGTPNRQLKTQLGNQSADARLLDIRAVQGFDKKATRATHAQLDEMVEKGGVDLVRGDIDKMLIDELAGGADGVFYPGQGVFGQGTYFDSPTLYLASGASSNPVTGPLNTAIRFAGGNTGAIPSAQPPGAVIRAVVKPGARMVSSGQAAEYLQVAATDILDDALREITRLQTYGASRLASAEGDELIEAVVTKLNDNIAKAKKWAKSGPESEVLELLPDDLASLGLEDLIRAARNPYTDDGKAAKEALEYLHELITTDKGHAMATLGYDGILAAESSGGVPGTYVVILNRDAVVFADDAWRLEDAHRMYRAAMDTDVSVRDAMNLSELDELRSAGRLPPDAEFFVD